MPTTGKKVQLIERLCSTERYKTQFGLRDCSVVLTRIPTQKNDQKYQNIHKKNQQPLKETDSCAQTVGTSRVLRSASCAQPIKYGAKIRRVESQPIRNVVVVNDTNLQVGISRVLRSASRPQTNNQIIAAKKPLKPRNRTKKTIMTSILTLRPALQKYELVWAHIKGYANWPCIIEGETQSGKYLVHFFGDYTKSEVTKNKIMHLLEGFTKYANAERPNHLLLKAIRETQMFLFE